ncbi:hypothetical protein PHSY_007509 [Pseudozyma hubeiensis SY62]|uniref:Uncharacterized protein n=1 Tax=Pseudozyma hubeiensis (strain SY62) TaxID=1305764 RepID=R9PEY9_PSEHS|nr:hypothetical protein PHSY_007509 [Pseudozyma hubeiensis SY62]GAC99906.1 hypothetical protein PHSY_007509 [Pseudozyma hubeiensis SY62]
MLTSSWSDGEQWLHYPNARMTRYRDCSFGARERRKPERLAERSVPLLDIHVNFPICFGTSAAPSEADATACFQAIFCGGKKQTVNRRGSSTAELLERSACPRAKFLGAPTLPDRKLRQILVQCPVFLSHTIERSFTRDVSPRMRISYLPHRLGAFDDASSSQHQSSTVLLSEKKKKLNTQEVRETVDAVLHGLRAAVEGDLVARGLLTEIRGVHRMRSCPRGMTLSSNWVNALRRHGTLTDSSSVNDYHNHNNKNITSNSGSSSSTTTTTTSSNCSSRCSSRSSGINIFCEQQLRQKNFRSDLFISTLKSALSLAWTQLIRLDLACETDLSKITPAPPDHPLSSRVLRLSALHFTVMFATVLPSTISS